MSSPTSRSTREFPKNSVSFTCCGWSSTQPRSNFKTRSYTILRPRVAQDLGFVWAAGQKVFVQVGDGSHIPVYLHKLEMQIGPKRFKATVGFSDKLGVGFHLLGRQDVFEHFRICFQERRRVVTFQPMG